MDRSRRIRKARAALLVVALAVPATLFLLPAEIDPGGHGRGAFVAGLLALIELLCGLALFAEVMTPGSAIEGEMLFTRMIPLRSILKATKIGAVSPKDITRAATWQMGDLVVLSIWARGGGFVGFNSGDNRHQLERSLELLAAVGIRVEGSERIALKPR